MAQIHRRPFAFAQGDMKTLSSELDTPAEFILSE
jgi:hypothetical protein